VLFKVPNFVVLADKNTAIIPPVGLVSLRAVQNTISTIYIQVKVILALGLSAYSQLFIHVVVVSAHYFLARLALRDQPFPDTTNRYILPILLPFQEVCFVLNIVLVDLLLRFSKFHTFRLGDDQAYDQSNYYKAKKSKHPVEDWWD